MGVSGPRLERETTMTFDKGSRNGGRLLEGKTFIVTGAGSGIGRAAAKVFSDEGATLLLGDSNMESVTEVTKALNEGGGVGDCVEVDVIDEMQVRQMVERAVERFGTLDG